MNLNPVVILAGGLATRLRPITEKIPKALVEVGGQPFIVQQLRLLHSYGISQVIISAWYKGEMIEELIGSGKRFDMDVRYVFDGERPLGTGGAIRRAMSILKRSFFVLYGDSYLPCDYAGIQTYFTGSKQLGLMTVYRNKGKWDASNVELKSGRIIRYDKKETTPEMKYIDYGLGMFHPEAFMFLPDGQPADLADIYQKLLVDKQLSAYEVKKRFYEIGSFEGLHELDGLLTQSPDQFLQKE